jgi:hypothetical protein
MPGEFCQLTALIAYRLRSRERARCVPDGAGDQGIWRTLTDRERCRRSATMLVTALTALIPKLIVRDRFSSPVPSQPSTPHRRWLGAGAGLGDLATVSGRLVPAMGAHFGRGTYVTWSDDGYPELRAVRHAVLASA